MFQLESLGPVCKEDLCLVVTEIQLVGYVHHPLYSTELSCRDLHIFGNFTGHLPGKRFETAIHLAVALGRRSNGYCAEVFARQIAYE